MNYLNLKKKSFSLLQKNLFLLLLFFAEFSFAQQQWYSTTVPRNRHVNSLKFLSHDDILFGGGNEFYGSLEEIWMSHDKGLEWENVNNTMGQPWIKSMAFIDTMQGYAVGDSATILRTVNGAHFWTILPKPIQNREFNKIIYVTRNILFIVGGSIPYPEIIVGGGGHVDTMQTIVKSTDGGNTWTVMLDRKGFWLNGASFTDSLHAIAVGDKGNILKTIDGGVNWTAIVPPVDRNFNAVKFISPTVGYAVGGINRWNPFTLVFEDSLSTILRTNNGGASWSVLKDDLNGILNDITFSSDSIGYIVGDKATLLKTTNAGTSWTSVVIPGAASDQTFNCVEFKNDHLGMIGCRNGYLHVYTTSALADAYTFGAKYVDSTTVTMFGGVKTHGDIATYTFLISLDSTFTNYSNVFPNPGDIQSDSLIAFVQSDLSNILPPHTTFYYTLQARTLAGYTNGDTLSFTIEAPKYIFQTLPATDVSTLSATLNGQIFKFPTDVSLSFEYGKSPLLGNEIAAVPSSINDTLFHNVSAFLNTLESGSIYYFRLKGTHNGQSYYGDMQILSTVNSLQIYPASNITLTSATLNGVVTKLGASSTISFEYGSSPSFGNEVAATPGTVNDTLFHAVYADINNLEPNTTYYYRIKGVHNSQSFYSLMQLFKTANPYSTLPATNVTATGATLNGFINHSAVPATVSFEYDTAINFGHSITAIDSIVNDTLSHSVYAVLTGLQNNKIYYFRLKGVHNTDIYYGDIQTFFTGTLYKTFQTLPATTVTDFSATLNGMIDKFSIPVDLSFEYGPSLSFGNEVIANLSYVDDTFQHAVSAYLYNLIPNVQYYFRLKGKTALTDFYGDVFIFQTGLSYSFYNTLSATNISNTTAQLNGKANHLSNSVTLSFEWGPTPAFGNSITADPAAISDTFSHDISANISGLLQDQVYFFRLKAISNGTPVYGETKQFYTGANEIPNWDFQFWKTDTVQIPNHWNPLFGTFDRVPGHSGNYGLMVFGQNIVINGLIGNEFFGGQPLNVSAPPDSIVGFLNYDIIPGDSAGMLLILKKNSRIITTQENGFLLTGNSGGVYKRVAFKITYDTLAVPDTALMICAPTNHIEGPDIHYHNTIIVDDISFLPGNNTFANSDFEDWFPSYVDEPLNWFNFRYVLLDTLDPAKNHLVSKVFFNPPGDYAASIQNVIWPGVGVAGGELSTHVNAFSDKTADFAVKGRHVTLNGYYKYFPDPGDSMRIGITMFKGGLEIGMGDLLRGDTVADFTPFSIPINYILGADIPDSATISLKSSFTFFAKPGSRLIVDKLSFDGFVSGVPHTEPDLLELDGMKVYPNPARDYLMIENIVSGNKECILSLFDMTGQILREIKLPPGHRSSQMEVGDFSPGFYVLVMKKGNRTYNKKIVIAK